MLSLARLTVVVPTRNEARNIAAFLASIPPEVALIVVDTYRRYYRWFAAGQALLDFMRIPAASGSNLLVAADAFTAVGGFDTRLRCNEDSERLARAGFLCRFERKLVVWASDHRRLHRGRLLKVAHSLLRCVSLFFGLVPQRWRSHDWGYWSQTRRPSNAP